MLQWMDDFTIYGTDGAAAGRMLNGPYAETTRTDLQPDPDPTAGGAMVARKYAGGLGGDFRKVLTGPKTTVGAAARYWLAHLPISLGVGECPSFQSFRDVNNLTHIRVSLDPSGNFIIYRNDNPEVQVAATVVPCIVANAWRHIEIKCVLDAAAGSVEIRLEGESVLTYNGRTTSNRAGAVASISQVAPQSPQNGGTAPDMYIKDYILWDGTGALNNDFMGSCQVYKIIPDSDVSLGWTPSAGLTGYNKINDTTPDDDAGYITAPFPLPAPSEFTLSDLPVNVTSVRGVMTIHRSRKTDGGDGNLQASLVYSGSTESGANRTITTAYTYWWDMFDQAPGGVNWSRLIVNATDIKMDRTV